MRVLLDENLPHDLAALLVGHQVATVAGLGWSGIQNGELLARATSQFDALLTMDQRLPDQQRIAGLSFGVILIQAPSNRMRDLRPLVPELLRALSTLGRGMLLTVGA